MFFKNKNEFFFFNLFILFCFIIIKECVVLAFSPFVKNTIFMFYCNFFLRFLATGESYASLAFSYRVGKTTVSNIVPKVCEAIWDGLVGKYMVMPESPEDWRRIAQDFKSKWNFPHCVGALDGKHVVIQCPDKTGSLHFNYKGTYSVVLLGLVDAHYRFTYIDVGAYGRGSDGGIFAQSTLGKALAGGKLSLPQDEVLQGAEGLGLMPYVIVADAAFPLRKHIMRPYPGHNLPVSHMIFNYRLSRSRRIVENAFGILSSRWRIYLTRIAVRPEVTAKIIKATCVLHNMLLSDTATTTMQDGEGRVCDGLQDLARVGNRATLDALNIRDSFARYFTEYDALPWQDRLVTRGMFTPSVSD